VDLIVFAYLSLEASSSSILSGSQALADALVMINVSYRESMGDEGRSLSPLPL